MDYIPLSKIYYKDHDNYLSEYQARLALPGCKKLNFKIGNTSAFFVECPEVTKLMYNIFRQDKILQELYQELPTLALKHFSQTCLIDEIVITNNIEGVHSSRKEIGEALAVLEHQSEQKGQKLRFLGMVNQYNMLMGQSIADIKNVNDIRAIYDKLIEVEPENVPDGKLFRKEQVTIYNEAGKTIHNGISPESKIIESLEKALEFLQDDSIEYRYRICIFHYLIEYIHPFYDGNGRLGRFLFSSHLMSDFTPLLAFHISETIKENIRDYYKAFQICNSSHNYGDLTPFLIMMLEMIQKSAVELNVELHKKLDELNFYRNKISELPNIKLKKMPELYESLLEATLFGDIGVTIKELSEQIGLSIPTLRKRLKELEQRRLLTASKNGREKTFILNLSRF